MADVPADPLLQQDLQISEDVQSIGFDEKYDLSFVDVMSPDEPGSDVLKDLRLLVIGAGPAGLIFARQASKFGAHVIVFEKASDPRGDNQGYTDRSFNITLENVGRLVLGEQKYLQGGVRVIGRALYPNLVSSNAVYTKYGPKQDDDIISIPRPILRQHMVNEALKAGANIHFNSKVIDLDPDNGILNFRDEAGNENTENADLIIVADGLHSIGDKFVLKIPDAHIYFNPDRFACVTTNIHPKSGKLSLHHINFWHEPGNNSFTIGVPNADGSVALLICSTFENIENQDYPFTNKEVSKKLLQSSFPNLYSQFPELIEVLPERRKYNFFYKAVSNCVIGDKAVLMGDSACVMPVWAAFGANNAMYGAASLVYWLVHKKGNTKEALEIFQKQQQILSQLILDYVHDQGEFLSGPVMEKPDGRSETSLAPLIKIARQKSGTL